MSDVSEEISPDDVPVGEDDLMPEDELLGLEFADNPEPRCPVLIIADCSGSMAGRPIDAMNRGVDDLFQAIIDDEIARNRVEVALSISRVIDPAIYTVIDPPWGMVI